MTTVEKINQQVLKLPEPLQKEILNFVEFLRFKHANGNLRQDDALWSQFSLAEAMRGMENEDFPRYDESDLKERWQ
jgi:hypothetical protein